MSSESALKQGNCFSELRTSVADVSFRSANATGLSSLQLWLASSIRGFPSFCLGGSNRDFEGTIEGVIEPLIGPVSGGRFLVLVAAACGHGCSVGLHFRFEGTGCCS